MSKTTDNIIRLINAGGNLNVNAENKTTDNLIRIVKVAIKQEKVITFRNLEKKTTDNLIRIIKIGGDNVVLEI